MMFKRAMPLALTLWLLGCAPSSNPMPELALIEDTRQGDSAPLMRAIGVGEEALRRRAIQAAGRIQSLRYLPALAEAAADESASIRREALFALGQFGLRQSSTVPPSARSAARRALRDTEPRVRAVAVEAFGKLGDAAVAGELVESLRDESPGVRAAAAMALFRCRFTPIWRGEASSPPELPAAATTALIDTLNDPDPDVRYRTVYAFSRYGERQAVEALAAIAGDGDWRVRMFALRALGNSLDAEAARAALMAGLIDVRVEVRIEAVRGLAALGLGDALPDSCLADASPFVRAACARGWAKVTSARSQRALEKLLVAPELTVRVAALEAVAERGIPGLESWLDAATADEAWQLRVAAALAGGGAMHPLRRAEAAFSDADRRVRTAAIESLAGRDGGLPLLLRAIQEKDLALRATAVAGLAASQEASTPEVEAALLAAYRDSSGIDWIEVREGIVDALAASDAAASILLEMLGDTADSVRRKAFAALVARGIDASFPSPAIDPSPFLGVHFDEDPVVVLQLSRGSIAIQCFAEEAPLHVAAFIDLVERGFYDGLIWHRVVPNFVIQGGDPRGDGWGGAGFTLRDEIGRRRFERGSVGMPKAGKDTGGGQLFITHVPTPHLDGNYTIFGQVIEGMDLLDAIEIGDTILRAERR